MIRDCIVFGVSDIRLKEQLLRESSELTLEKAASLCRAAEESVKQLKELWKQNVDPSEPEVHVVKKPTRGESLFDCNRCGTKHAVRSCPAFGKPCHKCKRKNHFARMCQMSRNSSVDEVSENTGEANTRNDPTLELNSLFIGTITSPTTSSAWFVSVGINGTQVRFKLDTGAEANVLPFNVYSSLEISTSLQKTDVVLTSYGNFKVKPEGRVFLRCVVNEVFEGLGSMDGEYHIVVDKTVKPVIHPPRKVNSLVMVEKCDASLRLCLDPCDLNKAIQREHHRIPTAEDIATRLSGKKLFSIVDEKDGFWQIHLDEESSHLCTFNTPFGRFRFTSLPFGVCSAPEVFQKKNEALFGDIDGVKVIFDDIIVAARDEKEHDEIMAKLSERAKAENVKFNPEKLQYKVKEVKYMGNIVSESGLKPDSEKVRAILDMPLPKSKQELRSITDPLDDGQKEDGQEEEDELLSIDVDNIDAEEGFNDSF
ncbi:Hypothetical predicted protein [Paramuricea clavata]|uniref:Uncharacterized protein n=1 Tax=Paramuricea clavata TaxID=317549 RepID=A0A7D9D9K5_PARCT|nr:Hypothetical predicted protein [Paramuricea clavata]